MRESKTLDGTWRFSTDPDEVGEKEEWFKPGGSMLKMPLKGYSAKANGSIQVPGIWLNQGYGDATNKSKHHFIGKGWYKRTFTIPSSWQGQKIHVILSGISRYAKIWINGQSAGAEAIGYITPHEREITKLVRFDAENDITICVDSKQRHEIDTLWGCSASADGMGIAWGGLWGHVSLEARPHVCLDSLYLRGNIHKSTCTVETTILADSAIDKGYVLRLNIFDKGGKSVAQGESPVSKAGEKSSVSASIPDAKLWSPDTPHLYDVQVSLLYNGKIVDRIKSRFGLRELKFDGEKIMLNGHRIFLAGIGDDHVYPEEFSMPSDKKVHLERLKIIKSFGFNHVRHHSTMMPVEYYEACDELGIISTCEFPIGYRTFLPGGSVQKSKTPPGTTPDAALATYYDRFRAAVLQYRNHPSISWWVGGNELYDLDSPFVETFDKIVKELDPDRVFVLSDGCSFSNVRPEYKKVMSVQFLEWGDLFALPKKYQRVPSTNKAPVLVHEMGNYLTFPKLDQAELFAKTVFKPFWFTPGIEILKKNGLYNETDNWAKTTEKQYLLTHKFNTELMRKNDHISGYHWWLFQDYWTSSNGIVDLFFRMKSFRPSDFLPFNSDVVLLQDGLKFQYRTGDTLQLDLQVSNFSRDDLTGELTVESSVSDGDMKRVVYPQYDAPCGGLNKPVKLSWKCPKVDKPTYITINASYEVVEKKYNNSWSTWIYPKEVAKPKTSMPIYCDSTLTFFPKNWSMLSIPKDQTLPADAIYLTPVLNAKLIDVMNRGARVICFGTLPAIANREISWQSSWWTANARTVMSVYACCNHTGTFVYPNLVTDEIVREQWCDISWYELIQGSYKDIFSEKVPRPEILIRTVPSILAPEDSSILYQAGVGKGKLIVSTLNHEKAKGLGTNDWLCAELIKLADSVALPKVQWTPDQFYQPVTAPNGWTVGYSQVKKFRELWRPSFSYRGDADRTTIVRQAGIASRQLSWWTQPVLPEAGPDRSFIFAGSFGFAKEPREDGFFLSVNDHQKIIPFDLPLEDKSTSWKSKDGRCELKFELKRKVGENFAGIFVLTVPKEYVTDGEPTTLTVHSLRAQSKRWFGLQTFVNF